MGQQQVRPQSALRPPATHLGHSLSASRLPPPTMLSLLPLARALLHTIATLELIPRCSNQCSAAFHSLRASPRRSPWLTCPPRETSNLSTAVEKAACPPATHHPGPTTTWSRQSRRPWCTGAGCRAPRRRRQWSRAAAPSGRQSFHGPPAPQSCACRGVRRGGEGLIRASEAVLVQPRAATASRSLRDCTRLSRFDGMCQLRGNMRAAHSCPCCHSPAAVHSATQAARSCAPNSSGAGHSSSMAHPARSRLRAAVRPEMPAPTITTSTSVRLAAQPPGWREGGLSVPCGSSAGGGNRRMGGKPVRR